MESSDLNKCFTKFFIYYALPPLVFILIFSEGTSRYQVGLGIHF